MSQKSVLSWENNSLGTPCINYEPYLTTMHRGLSIAQWANLWNAHWAKWRFFKIFHKIAKITNFFSTWHKLFFKAVWRGGLAKKSSKFFFGGGIKGFLKKRNKKGIKKQVVSVFWSMILFHLFLGGFSKIPNSKKIVFKMFFRPFYVILDNFRNKKFLLFIWGRTEGVGGVRPKSEFFTYCTYKYFEETPTNYSP